MICICYNLLRNLLFSLWIQHEQNLCHFKGKVNQKFECLGHVYETQNPENCLGFEWATIFECIWPSRQCRSAHSVSHCLAGYTYEGKKHQGWLMSKSGGFCSGQSIEVEVELSINCIIIHNFCTNSEETTTYVETWALSCSPWQNEITRLTILTILVLLYTNLVWRKLQSLCEPVEFCLMSVVKSWLPRG